MERWIVEVLKNAVFIIVIPYSLLKQKNKKETFINGVTCNSVALNLHKFVWYQIARILVLIHPTYVSGHFYKFNFTQVYRYVAGLQQQASLLPFDRCNVRGSWLPGKCIAWAYKAHMFKHSNSFGSLSIQS